MRLSTLITRLRRNRLPVEKQTSEEARAHRDTMTIEAMTRAAQSRSLRGGMRPR